MARFLNLEELFERRHFDSEIMILCVGQYLRLKLSSRDLVEMMEECCLSIAHTTIMRWAHHSAPEHGAVRVKIYLRHATNPQRWTIREEPAILARTSRQRLACGGSRRRSEP
jgi:transposase-like protein